MTSTIKLKDHMDSQPLQIPMGTPLAAVIPLLAEHDTSGAVVVNGRGELEGFVSEQDCLKTLQCAGNDG